MKLHHIFFHIFFTLLCGGTLFAVSPAFAESETAPKAYSAIFGVLACMLIFILLRIEIKKLILPFCIIITALCTAQAIYGILQFFGVLPSHSGFRVTGSFDNPAGFAACLCAGVPFCLAHCKDAQLRVSTKIHRIFTILCFAIIAFAVALSASRAGMVSLAIITLILFFKWIKRNRFKKPVTFRAAIFGIIVVLLFLFVGLYFLKKDSADGRVLIWNVTAQMIAEKPFLGYGAGGFKSNYMNFQAQYFAENPESKFAMLADNIGTPFNEYLLLLTDFGIAGFAVFIVFAFFIWKLYKRNNNLLPVQISGLCLLSIAVFSLFSYPLKYPFAWVAGIFSIFTILFYSKIFKIKISRKISVFLKISIVLSVFIAGYFTVKTMNAEIHWCKVANQSLMGRTEEMLPYYEKLHKTLKHNNLFLYNYAAELNVAEHYEKSLQIAFECTKLWSNYDLQMLVADNYLQLKCYSKAEQHYRKASKMCPVKFMPLYKLFQLYEITNENKKASETAKIIIAKPVKILSPTVMQIKNETRQKTE